MTRKYISVALCISLALCMTACANNNNNSQNQSGTDVSVSAEKEIPASKNEDTTATSVDTDAEEAAQELDNELKKKYEKIENEYITASKLSREDYGSSEPKYPDVDIAIMQEMLRDGGTLYSAYYDMNGDGTEELLIATKEDEDIFHLAALYTYDNKNNKTVRVPDSDGFWYNAFEARVLQDGTVWKYGYGDDGSTYDEIYGFSSDGLSMERKVQYTTELSGDRDFIAYKDGDRISKSEYQNALQNLSEDSFASLPYVELVKIQAQGYMDGEEESMTRSNEGELTD